MNVTPPHTKFVFGPFELDPRARELRKRGRKIRIPEQSFQILCLLVEQPAEIVARDQIRQRLWPNGTLVEFEDSIHAAVKKLRLALGDSAEAPRYVETLPRRGYRLMVRVERLPSLSARGPHLCQGAAIDPFRGDLTGRRISHYRVLSVIGGGAMGLVYQAEDLKLGRRVALKFLAEELAKEPLAIARLRREACAASALTHPNICTLYAIEEEGEHTFIAMELLEGATLRDRITRKQFTVEEVLRIGIQIADAIQAAHAAGIIHRDVKPANIFITDRQQVKILDFGVAKYPGAPELQAALAAGPQSLREYGTRIDLTKTGMRMGTAAYMSPEQIRGEQLDSRTDLFSFGLVLYEMVTGCQAFEQPTVSLLHDAILHQSPVDVREMNPQAPAGLVQIIERAIQKDRNSRYQSAARMRDDLVRLRERRSRTWSLRRVGLMAAAAVFSLGVVAVLRWPVAPARSSVKDLNQRKLTSNSADNPLRGGGYISPDAKYLAYADRLGLHVQLIQTGEITTVPQPEGFDARNTYWSVGGWFPSSKEFLANSRRVADDAKEWTSAGASIWAVSFPGAPRKIRDNAEAWSVSTDGRWIAFGSRPNERGDREMWLMGPNGESPHKLFETSEQRWLGGLHWSMDGRHVTYGDCDKDRCEIVSRELSGSSRTLLASWRPEDLHDLLWLPDGRMLYILPDSGPSDSNCNLWQQRVDPRTGRSLERPVRITGWAGFCMDSLSSSFDSKHVAFTRWSSQTNIWIGDVTAIANKGFAPAPLTMNDGWNNFVDWTPDSKTVLFISDRNGKWQIFSQSVEGGTAQPLWAAESSNASASTDNARPDIMGEAFGARLTPDGRWLLYLTNTARKTVLLMRVPLAGGAPERVTEVRPGVTFSCSKAIDGACVIAERTPSQTEILFSTLEPLNGRKLERARIRSSPEPHPWALSQDGQAIAVHTARSNHFDVIGSRAGLPKSLELQTGSALGPLSWNARGDGLFVSAISGSDALVVLVDLNGNERIVWRQTGDFGLSAAPSPDSRLLAVTRWRNSSNVWMIDNF